MESLKNKQKIRNLTITGLATAVLCAVSPLSVPIGDIPISLATLVICITAVTMGSMRAATATVIFLILGCLGIPVFSGFTAGMGRILGPTGGYLIGYIPLALIAGISNRHKQSFLTDVILMGTGTAVLYLIGTVWYCVYSNVPPETAVITCVLPFLPGDTVKIVTASVISKRLRRVFG